MRTQYFQKIRLSEAGKRRFTALVNLPDETRVKLIEWIAELETIPRVYSTIIQSIAGSTKAPADKVADAINIALDVVSDLGKFNDKVEDFIKDAQDAGLIDGDKQYNALSEFLKAACPHGRKIYLLERVYSAENSGGAILRHSSTSVAIKPVFDEDFEYGSMDITKYNPAIVKYTPTAQVELSIDNRAETVTFQLAEESLDRFLSDLLALQAQIKATREVLEKMPTTEQRRLT